MSNFSATAPIAFLSQANLALEELGYGPNNFSVPSKSGGSTMADYAGLHCWDHPTFLADVKALDVGFGVEVTEAGTGNPAVGQPDTTGSSGQPNFDKACAKQNITWVQAVGSEDPNVKMKDATVSDGGKNWVSLIDNNIWKPPVGWREVVAIGFPAWVQPTGAHDAYSIGDKIKFNSVNYESLINSNVWSPTGYPTGWKQL